jgi:uncharacterized protein (DUF427 family)
MKASSILLICFRSLERRSPAIIKGGTHFYDTTFEEGNTAKAIWEGVVLAESDSCVVVEGNHYFPPTSIRREYFRPSDKTTICSWKGVAHYYDIEVNGKRNPNAAWYYPQPKEAARQIKDHVAFWNGVRIEP